MKAGQLLTRRDPRRRKPQRRMEMVVVANACAEKGCANSSMGVASEYRLAGDGEKLTDGRVARGLWQRPRPSLREGYRFDDGRT